MWDNNIRSAYHRLHTGNHKLGSPECYLEFLRQSQEIIKTILNKRSEDDIWSDHLTFKGFYDGFFVQGKYVKNA